MSNDQLKTIGDDLNILMQDVNAIRNGEYDAPKGADPHRKNPSATMDDLYERLSDMTSLMETQAEHLQKIASGIERLYRKLS